jgi:hypothetical protein
VEALTGRRCHFFMTLSSEFDKALANAASLSSGNDSDAARK